MRNRKGVVNGKWDPLYQLWRQAKGRCRNSNKPDYKWYGGRGITFWPGWDEYEQFAADVGPHPGNGLTLERKDNNKGYEPGNICWATRKEQGRNRPGYVMGQATADKIRAEYIPGVTRQIDIAAKHGVQQQLVSKIVRGRIWA